MAFSIHLDFVQPTEHDLVKLHIYESDDGGNSFVKIETVTAIGSYPDYITEYTTALATSASGLFYIEWEDSKGAKSGKSGQMQAGQATLVGEITDRVMLRDSGLREAIVVQEAETVIHQVFGSDPYDPQLDADVTYEQKRGITNMTLAYCYLTQMASTTGSTKWMAGIVSMQTSDVALKNRVNAVDKLIRQAGIDLGMSYSVILQMAEISRDETGIVGFDQSRLLLVEAV